MATKGGFFLEWLSRGMEANIYDMLGESLVIQLVGDEPAATGM